MVKYKETCAASSFSGQVPEHMKGNKVVKIYPWHSEVLDLQKVPAQFPGNKQKSSKKL